MSRFKSALALSGGSARALSHLGVIQGIERRNLKFDLIVGTSMGAVIGGLYACFGDSARVIERLKKLFESELFLKTASIAVDEDFVFAGPVCSSCNGPADGRRDRADAGVFETRHRGKFLDSRNVPGNPDKRKDAG